MKTFFTWLESLTWQQGVELYLAIVITACAVIYAVDRWLANAELRAIKRRDRNAPKPVERRAHREMDLLQFPIERTRAKQFNVPRSMRDFKVRS